MGIGKRMGSATNLNKAAKRNSNSNMWSIPEAGIIVRFLDEPEDWFGYSRYYDEDASMYVPMVEGERAPQGARQQYRFVANAVKVDDDRVIAFDMPKSMGSAMHKYYDKYGTLLDRDYDFSKSGSGLQTEYAVAPDAKEPKKLTKYDKLDLEDVLSTQRTMALGEDTDTADEDKPKAKASTKTTTKPKPAPEPVDEDEDEDDDEGVTEDELVALGKAADKGDEDATETLTEYAGQAELDPDEYETWAELATAIIEALSEGEDEEDADEEEEEEESDDDDSEEEEAEEEDDEVLDEDQLRAMALPELKEIAKEYGIKVPTKIKVDALVDLIIEAAEEAE